MVQEVFSDWDIVSSNNITVTGDAAAIDIDEGMAPGLVNNAMRAIMSAAVKSWGGMHAGTSRPADVQANRFWLNTTSATAPVVTWYDGTDNIAFFTVDNTTNVITFDTGVVVPGGLSAIVEDTTPQLGGALDVNGKDITSASSGDVTISPNGTGTIILEAGAVSRADISSSGLRIGTGARVTTILDEDDMASDSATALATQQSIKAAIDAGGSFGSQLLHVREEQTSGTSGGTFTSGAWQTRTLNTVITNEITGASVAANQITLPAGTYAISSSAPAHKVNDHQAKLYNITDAADELIGTSERTQSTISVGTRSFVFGRFTIPGAEVFELRHQAQTTAAVDGFGQAVTFGVTEVFSEVQIWKVG